MKNPPGGFPDNGRRIDRITAVGQVFDPEDRVIVAQRIIAVMVAERSFGRRSAGAHHPDESELGIGEKRMWTGPGTSPDATTGEQRRQHEFRNILGQRRNRRQDQRWRTTDKHRHRKPLARAASAAAW